MIYRPCICFLGDEKRCYDVICRFSGSIRPVYIRKNYIDSDRISDNLPIMICILLQKGKHGSTAYYSEAFTYSQKAKCPVYVICSEDQYDGIRNNCQKAIVSRVTLSGLYKIIRDAIKISSDNPNAELELVKSKFDTVAVLSSEAILASYCEGRIGTQQHDARRVIITSPEHTGQMDNISENEHLSGVIVTEDITGAAPVNLKEIGRKITDTKIPVILVGTHVEAVTPKRIAYLNLSDDVDKIDTALHKAHKARIRRISYGKNAFDD